MLKYQFCAAFQVQEVWLVALYCCLSHRCETTRVILWGKTWIESFFHESGNYFWCVELFLMCKG